MGQYNSAAAEEKVAIATVTGILRGIAVTNVAAAVRYVWCFDNKTAASGSRICSPFAVQPGQTVAFDFDPTCRIYANGLYVASSTTQGTYTPSTTADLILEVDTADEAILERKAARRMLS